MKAQNVEKSERAVHDLNKLSYPYRVELQNRLNKQKQAKISTFFKESEKKKKGKRKKEVVEEHVVPVIDLTDQAACEGTVIAECNSNET